MNLKSSFFYRTLHNYRCENLKSDIEWTYSEEMVKL
jgi:hypothetical protein